MTPHAYKTALLARFKVSDHFAFVRLSPAHAALWKQLNAIGARGFAIEPLPPNIDDAVEMTTDEGVEANRFADWLVRADAALARNADEAAHLAVERAARTVVDATGIAPIDTPALEAITALREALAALDKARDGRAP